MDEKRFDRLETKIDNLTEAVTAVVRVEEQLLASNKRVDRLEYRADILEGELDEVADLAKANSGVARFADKFFWLVIGGLVSFSVWVVRTGISG